MDEKVKEALASELKLRRLDEEAQGKTTIDWIVFRAMRGGYNVHDHGFLNRLWEVYDQEDGLADIYRQYLRKAIASAPKVVPGPGRIISQREGRPADIAELEDVFRNEHNFHYNPFSGFACYLFRLSPQHDGPALDSLFETGGP